jgi:hypothetical protein
MSPIKIGCIFWPPPWKRVQPDEERHDEEMHPSWAAGLEALQDYNHWVNAVVLPIAFQWIEEHKTEVYENVPEHLRDDIGVAIAAAFHLVRELPAYQRGRANCDAHEAGLAEGAADPSAINPVWTGITKKMREKKREVFAEHSQHLGDTTP